jgi:class 3 adenylate cyclase
VDRVGELESFVSRWLLRTAAGKDAPLNPFAKSLWAAVLFADISGFTQMTRLYQDRGDAGVEELALIVGRYLGGLIDRVFGWGGDIEKLYGDAFLAFWPASEADREGALRNALGCASDMITRYDRQTVGHGTVLRLRGALAVGDLRAVQVGGRSGQWHFFITGPCLSDLSNMLAAAPPGKIFTSADVRSAFPSLPELAAPAQIDAAAKTAPAQPCPSLDGPPSEAFLRAFLPAPLRRQDRLRGEWLAEFRWLAVVAVGMTDLRCNDESGLALTQSVVMMLQDCAELFDGAFTSFTMSDKGPMAIIAFGLPGQAHDDDAARAVRLADKAQAALASEGVAGRATVTFGLAYCGVVGNRERKDYAIIGDAINRAAKLVSRKDAPSLVCDQAIAEKAGPWITFEPLSEPQGRDASLFRPVFESKAPGRRPASFHGRETEMSWLQGRLDEVRSGPGGLVLYIEGEAGMGKSTLAAALADLAGDRFVFLWGHADIFANAAAPFATWRPIFAEIFTYEGAPDALLADVHGALERQGLPPERAGFASVVLPLLPARVPDGLRPDDVARLTCETLAALLRDGVAERRAVLVLDDVHWMDTGSWMLVAQAAQDVAGVLPVLLARPAPDGEWPGMERLALTTVDRLRLAPLSRTAIGGVIHEALGDEPPEEWSEALAERSGGNPLFARQLALALRDQRAPATENASRSEWRSTGLSFASRLPDSIQRAIVARVDCLPADLQIVLKASSVIGTTFLLRAVMALLAFDDGASHVATLRERLDQLVEFGMLAVERTDPDPSYRFDHALTQEAIYHLLSFENRRRLHAATATFLESESEARQPGPATLGLHWSRAGRPERAQPNWEAAAISALSAGAYREAAAAFREALAELHALPERLRAPSDSSGHSGRLRHLLGEALLQAGEVPESQVHLIHALRDFGHPWAGGRFGVVLALASAIAIQVSQEVRTRGDVLPFKPLRSVDGKDAETAVQAALTLETLGQAFAHRSQLLASVTATLVALNLAQRAGDAPLYTRAAGLMSLVLGAANMPGLGGRYLAHARHHLPEVEQRHDRLMSTEYIAMSLLMAGRLAEVKDLLVGMRDLAASSSNRRRLLDATSLLILTLLERQEHGACAELLADFVGDTERSGDPQLRCWSLLEAAELALRMNDLDSAGRRLDSAQRLLGRVGRNEAIWTTGLLALLDIRQARAPKALAKARTVLSEMAAWRSVGFYAHPGVYAAADIYLELLADEGAAHRADARKIVSRAQRFGLRFPLTRARSLTAAACYFQLCGRRANAARAFELATAHAQELELTASLSAVRRWRERLGA